MWGVSLVGEFDGADPAFVVLDARLLLQGHHCQASARAVNAVGRWQLGGREGAEHEICHGGSCSWQTVPDADVGQVMFADGVNLATRVGGCEHKCHAGTEVPCYATVMLLRTWAVATNRLLGCIAAEWGGVGN